MGSWYLSGKACRGAVLIMVLWTLTFLAIFAVGVGAVAKQKIYFISRIEQRSFSRDVAASSIKKAVAIVTREIKENPDGMTAKSKENLFDNEQEFRSMIGTGEAAVGYLTTSGLSQAGEFHYGLIDEAAKININYAELPVMTKLISVVLGFNEKNAGDLALAIVDWRKVHSSELVGFESEKYYENLPDPYSPKNSNFESVDELTLIKGVDRKTFKVLRQYLTLYTDGQVNVNTVSEEVLTALGLSPALAQKIVSVRRGSDGREATSDDVIFKSRDSFAQELSAVVELKDDEKQEIQANLDKFTVNSLFYFIESRVKINNKDDKTVTQCVYDVKNHEFVYWKEGFAF